MGAVTLVGVGTTVWGATSVTPDSVAGVANGDQPFMLVCSKRPSVVQPAAPAGWTRDFSEIGNPGGTVTPSEGPFYLQVHSRNTVVSGGSISWPSVGNGSGSQQVIGATAVVARPASGESLVWDTAWGQDLDGGTSYSVTAGTALDLGPGDLVVAFTAITDNNVTSSGGTISAAGITFGATTEQRDSSSGNGDDLGCYVHTAAVTSGTATVAPTLTQTLSSSDVDFNRGATVFLRIRSLSPTVDKSGSDTTGSGSESLTSLAVAVSGSDSGTGSESGFIADHKDGGDSGTGSEDGYVAQPTSGEDSGSGAEDGSVAAETEGSDSGTGSETAQLGATTQGSDSGEGDDGQGFITLPGADTATGAAALAALAATTSGADSATGSEGGYVEELFGNLVIGLWAIHPDTGEAVILPDFTKVDLSRERNGPGSITIEYPATGLNFDLLRDTITDDRDLEIEVWTLGHKTGALRGFLQEAAGDDVAEDGTWTFAGGFAELLLSEAAAWPAPIITTTTVTTTKQISEDPPRYQVTKKTTVGSSEGGPPVTSTIVTIEDSGYEGETVDTESTNGDLEFEAVTPGELAIFLVEQAQDRGALDGLELGFTDTHDSAGTPWPKTITTKFSPGSSYDSILNRLVEFGLAEWGVTWTGSAYRLDLWVIYGRGQDRTLGLRPIILRKGRNLLDAPRKWSVRDSGTALLAAGAEGVYEDASDAGALARRGRRIERFASANNLEDHSSLQGFAQNQLEYTKNGQLEVTHGIGFLPGEPRPAVAFDIGDWVYSQAGGELERLRVVQWTLRFDASGASGTVTLNDTITDALSRLKARLDNLVSGDTVVGTSEGSGGQDTSVPLPPEVVSADSIAFLDGTLGVRAAVTVALDMPVLNVDGTVITDLDQVIVEYALASSPDVWNAGITKKAPTSSAVFTAPAGQTIHIRAAVLDRQGNRSVWSHPPYPLTTSDDDIPPPIPSTPTVTEFLGTVRIAWDGESEDGVVMPEAAIDFDHVEIHMDPGSLFTPDETTLVGRMYGAGTFSVTDLPYGVEQFVRLVAVDWSGNRSDPSDQDSATPQQVVSADVFDGAIGTAKLADAAIVTAKIADLAVNNAKIADLSVGKLTAGNLNADVILSSGGIKTANSGTRVELDSAGLRLYNGSNTMVDLKTSNGSALVVGEFRTALSGQRIVFNPGGALPDTMYFYPSGAGDFARIMARTAPLDGTAAILIDGGAANGQSRGRLGAYRFESFLSFVTNDSGGDTSAGYSLSAVSVTQDLVNTWYQGAAHFTRYNNQNPIAGTRVVISSVRRGGSQRSTVIGDQQDCGIRFDDGAANVVKRNGTTFAPILASAFTVSSSREGKTDEAPIYLPADQVVRQIEAKQWRYKRADKADPDAQLQFGPMVEDLEQVMPELVREVSGTAAVSLNSLIGVLWEALRRALVRIEALEEAQGG